MFILIGSSETLQFFEYLIASIPAARSLYCIFFAVKDIHNNPACEYFEWLKPDPAKLQGEILRWDFIDQTVFSLENNTITASNAVVDCFFLIVFAILALKLMLGENFALFSDIAECNLSITSQILFHTITYS